MIFLVWKKFYPLNKKIMSAQWVSNGFKITHLNTFYKLPKKYVQHNKKIKEKENIKSKQIFRKSVMEVCLHAFNSALLYHFVASLDS